MEFILGIKEKGINTEYYLIDNKRLSLAGEYDNEKEKH